MTEQRESDQESDAPEIEEEERRSADDSDLGDKLRSWSAPLIGGVAGALAWFAIMFTLGSVGDLEARDLLESSMPSLRFATSTVATTAATILALMLTVLSLSNTMSTKLKSWHYRRIAQISWMSSASIITAVFIMILLAMPLAEAEKFPTSWFDYLYYAVLGSTAVVGGMFFTVVIMLLNAVRDLISVVSPAAESELVAPEAGD
jgi:hypothetical protein